MKVVIPGIIERAVQARNLRPGQVGIARNSCGVAEGTIVLRAMDNLVCLSGEHNVLSMLHYGTQILVEPVPRGTKIELTTEL